MSANDEISEREFRALYDGHARRLWAYLARVSGNPDAADDLLQECFLRYLRAAPRLDTDEHRKNYVFRIATNLLRDRHRRQAREPAALEDDPEDARPEGEAGLAAHHDVRSLLCALPERQRQLLWLAYVEGLSHREIAAQLALGIDSVRQLLLRARRRLARLYRGEESPGGDA